MSVITKPDGTLRSQYLVKFTFTAEDMGNFEVPFGMTVEAAKAAFIGMMKERAPRLTHLKITDFTPSPVSDKAVLIGITAETAEKSIDPPPDNVHKEPVN